VTSKIAHPVSCDKGNHPNTFELSLNLKFQANGCHSQTDRQTERETDRQTDRQTSQPLMRPLWEGHIIIARFTYH